MYVTTYTCNIFKNDKNVPEQWKTRLTYVNFDLFSEFNFSWLIFGTSLSEHHTSESPMNFSCS